MTETPALDRERRKVWWTTDHQPEETLGAFWVHCCGKADLASDPVALAEHVSARHSKLAGVVYRTRVYDNPDRTGEPLAVTYSPPDWTPPADAPQASPEPGSTSGQAGADRKDEAPLVEDPPRADKQPITTLEQLFAHMRDTVTGEGYDPKLGYRSPPLRIDTDDLPEGVRHDLAELLAGAAHVQIQDAKGVAEQRLIKAGRTLSLTLSSMQHSAKTEREDTDWWLHSDMLSTAIVEAAAFVSAWADWSTQA